MYRARIRRGVKNTQAFTDIEIEVDTLDVFLGLLTELKVISKELADEVSPRTVQEAKP